MKVGVALPHYGSDSALDRVVDIATECERLGFDSVWVSDHIVFDLEKYGGSAELIGSIEPMATLAVLAGATSKVRLGTMVLCNEFRHPVVLAKQAATVDIASGGRFELGIGAGWYEREFAMAGLDFPRPGVRLERLREAVEVLKLCFTGDPVSFEGRHYRLDSLIVLPRPAQEPRPTIWVGGKGDRAMKVIAEVADGWNAAWFQDADAYSERASLLGDSKVRRSVGQYAQGSAQEMVDRLKAFAGLGVEHAVMCFSTVPFGLDDPNDIAAFAQDVLPHVQG
jgi:probable F420-dependent oxidoreductase